MCLEIVDLAMNSMLMNGILMIILTWLVVEPYPSEKYEFVIWDDGHSQYMETHKMFQTTNQPNMAQNMVHY